MLKLPLDWKDFVLAKDMKSKRSIFVELGSNGHIDIYILKGEREMKSQYLTIVFVVASASQTAQAAEIVDVASVVSTHPVYVQNVPRQVCTNTVTQGDNSINPVGTLIGGMGNTVGKGNGKTAAAAVGAVTGALAGNSIANQPQQQQTCQLISDGSARIVGYDVTYNYVGRQATVRMSYDPGQTVRVGISAM